MKKFYVILFMSCLLNFMPIAFGADKSSPEITLFHDKQHGYCYQKSETRFCVPLSSLTDKHDEFETALKSIEKDIINDSKTSQSLPVFTLDMRDSSSNKVQVINPQVKVGDFDSQSLHELFKLESTKHGVYLAKNDEPIAILFAVMPTSYNPDNPKAKSDEEILPHITNTSIKNKETITETKNTPKEEISNKPSNWRTPLAIGTFVAIVAAALWYNKDLAPSMEAIFTRISSSCQGVFSRISSHTNNLRA